MQTSIGEKIMIFRKKRGWSQTELGTAANISRNYVSMIEHDCANVTLDTLVLVCHALGISVSIFLDGEESHLTPRALDGADWWDCECGVSNHPSWQACQFCKYPRRQ